MKTVGVSMRTFGAILTYVEYVTSFYHCFSHCSTVSYCGIKCIALLSLIVLKHIVRVIDIVWLKC